jgi:hypothetical protein
MAIQAFLAHYNYIWLLVILIVLFYAALKTIKLPGSEWVLALTSLLLSFMVISSTRITKYLIKTIPLLTIILVLGFFILLTLVLVAKDISIFKKPLAWIGFALAILIILCLAFSSFPTLNHLLPNSSDRGLDNNLIEFKDFIYSHDFKEGLVFVISVIVVGFFMLKK